jgi:hypothetical protein
MTRKTKTQAAPTFTAPAIPPADVLGRLAALKTAATPALKQQWRELFGTEPPPYNRRFLESRLAYRISVGARNWLTQAAKERPLIGPSMTQGATMRSCRRPARKVSVFQCPCGTLASSGVPRGLQPRVRVMLVLAQVSSTKTRRAGSNRC